MTITEMREKRAKLWNTMEVGRFSGGRVMIDLPSIVISPLVTSRKPPIVRRMVVLPQPEGPSRVTISPS